jgi:cobalamin biosynthetic protein CobC
MNKDLNLALKKPKHGGNLLAVRRDLSQVRPEANIKWIDLSSAVNRHPWPVPEVPVNLWHELPDLDALNQAAKRYYGRDNFVPIAGTQQAIEALPNLLFDTHKRASTKVLIPQIGYQEHGFAWSKWQYQLESYLDYQELLQRDWQVLVLIQPNNPSAKTLSLAHLSDLIAIAQARGAYIILDEAFIDAVSGASLIGAYQAKSWPSCLIVLRSVGKFFGLPGARVGFCFANPSVLQGMSSVIGPWPIATPAVWLITQAFRDVHWQLDAIDDLSKRSLRFRRELQPLINPLFDTVNWQQSELFFTLFSDSVDSVFKCLQALGIHVRLGPGWLRFALPADVEFDSLKSRMETLLKSHQKVSVLQTTSEGV